VDIRVTTTGPNFSALIRQRERDIKQANRKLASPVSKAGIKAIKSGAPTFRGKQLSARTDPPRLSGDTLSVTFYGTSAGAWAIKESGTDGPYAIRPKKGSVLAFPGAGRKTKRGGRTGVAKYVLKHPGITGTGAWTQAVKRLAAAVEKPISQIYDRALS
jgi:hypothetical protein